jgi:predicted nucleotidyltransferase
MLETLSDRPRLDSLRSFVDALLREAAGALELVVLYGSMARGDWSARSDFDLLVGLREHDGRSMLERLQWLSGLNPGGVHAVAYCLEELARMERDHHVTLLEAGEHGIELFDRGWFRSFRQRHRARVASGLPARRPGLWEVHDGRDLRARRGG